MSSSRESRSYERGQAAEGTPERILAAAVAEFGAKGYSGARTAGIAARAGVNQQLISYYFGGKQGLLDGLRRRWQELQAAMAAAVAKARQRHEDGEIRAGLDPAFALLAAYAIIFAPITVPQFVRDVLGGDPLSPETRQVLRTQLVKLLTED